MLNGYSNIVCGQNSNAKIIPKKKKKKISYKNDINFL